MSKLPKVGTTIFSVMSKLAAETGAINLSQGFPNFPVDPELTNHLKKIADQEFHQYMPMPGYPRLLFTISETIRKSYSRFVDPESEILVSAGATQGIFTTIMALVKSGSEVVILDPSYDCYDPAVILAGGRPVHVALNSDFTVSWNEIEKAINPDTSLLIINNPHNPSGRIWLEEDFVRLEALIQKYPDLLLLSDEVYEYITFEKKHISINTREKLTERSIIVSSFGKTFHITGWKVGYLVAPKNLLSEIKKVHQFNVFSVNSIAQATLADYLVDKDVSSLGDFYREKRDLFQALLAKSRFKLLPCEGTYFQVADFSDISDESDIDFCKRMTEKHGVAAIPVSVFNADQRDNKLIRFCFAKDDQTLINAGKKLCRI